MHVVLFFLTAIFSVMTFAHKAHVHGVGTLGIAFDGSKGKLLLEAPGEALMGFEYKPAKQKDIQKKDQVLLDLENKISEMVSFSKDLKCIFKKEKIDIHYLEGHAEVRAEFGIECLSSPKGSVIEFAFAKFFKGLQKVSADILLGDLQKHVQITGAGVKLELK